MKAIINTFAKSEYSHMNGKTFNICGHLDGKFQIETETEIILFALQELLLVDIENVFRHAMIRENNLGFDYWTNILKKYLKSTGIKLNISQNNKSIVDSEIIETNLAEINDEDIF